MHVYFGGLSANTNKQYVSLCDRKTNGRGSRADRGDVVPCEDERVSKESKMSEAGSKAKRQL